MNKKADISFVMKFFYLLVVFAVLLFVYNHFRAEASKVIPGTPEDTQTHIISESVIDEKALAIYTSLKGAFNKALSSQETGCYVAIDDFQEQDKSNIFVANIDGFSWIGINDQEKEAKIVKQEKIRSTTGASILPCVVDGQKLRDNIFGSANNVVDYTELAVNKQIFISEENEIIFDGTTYEIGDNDCCGTKKVNILYKPDANHLCFIPTYDLGSVVMFFAKMGSDPCPVRNGKIRSDCVKKLISSNKLSACVS